eukprot:CAMPEP_0184998416 /NCGR_PEP_ID=MMETSP1098-20130426/62280_1 /TAXON_ID=89044 /ORGANISM="Spumella elongata, Strain CCAP 955/1" /LENGTH=585 /DNA_ID=CAMNT_0027525209 /DNA_START=19 /DNA_END=1776 /DNA_ORIENTATION=+
MSSFDDSAAHRLKDDGNVLFRAKQYAEALVKYDEAVSLKADFKEALLNAAVCCRSINKLEDAVDRVVCAIKCDKQYAKAYNQLARILEDVGKLPSARRDSLFATCNRQLVDAGLMGSDAPYKLHFMIVDLKMSERNEVKVLEFGDGIRSGSDISDVQLSQGIKDIVGLPLLLSTRIGNPVVNKYDLNGTVEAWRLSKPLSCPQSPFCGAFGGGEIVPAPEDVLVLNADSRVVAMLDEKVNMHELFHRADLLHYRPVSKVYWRQYHINLAADICANIPGESVMLKNSDGCRGEGVIIVLKSKLDPVLKLLLANPENIKEVVRDVGRDVVEYLGDSLFTWPKTQRHVFVVEEIIKSKPVIYDGKAYDPAMRVTFLMYESPDRHSPSILPLSYYWKFPKQCSSNSFSRSNCISSFEWGSNPRRGAVSSEDQHLVLLALQDMLPTLFKGAHSLPFNAPLLSLQSFVGVADSSLQSKQDDAMRVLLANLAGHCGLYAQAIYYIYEYTARNPSDDTGRYETAMAHLLCKNFDEAITIFKTTNYDVKFFRIAQAYRLQGKMAEAKVAINMIPAQRASDPRVLIERGLIYNPM